MTVRRNPTPPSAGPGAETPCDAIVQPMPAPELPPGRAADSKANPGGHGQDLTPPAGSSGGGSTE